MPRNGSGTATIPNSFTPSTTISSSAVNANFADVAAELTNSVAVDGQSTMTGALKAAPGAALTPSITFGADADTGLYRKGANQLGFATGGVERGYFDTTGVLALIVGATAAGNTVDAFPTGTKMLFQQTAAPTGWTKDTTHNNKALRVVSGAASSGGTQAFTTAIPSGAVGGTTLDITQIPAHTHTYSITNYVNFAPPGSGAVVGQNDSGTNTGSAGGGASHTHSFTGSAIDLAYVDIIIATKN